MKLMQERLTADRQLAKARLFVTCVKFQLTLFNFWKVLGGINRFDLVSLELLLRFQGLIVVVFSISFCFKK